jgi:hypothetical protein
MLFITYSKRNFEMPFQWFIPSWMFNMIFAFWFYYPKDDSLYCVRINSTAGVGGKSPCREGRQGQSERSGQEVEVKLVVLPLCPATYQIHL